MQVQKEKTILVTGASGLVGRELVRQLLEQEVRVKAIYRNHPILDLEHPLLTKHHCDLLDVMTLEELMQGVSHVYHCAGFISYDPRQRRQLYQLNVEATANVVNACLHEGVEKLVHVSSIAALGSKPDQSMVDESVFLDGGDKSSLYGTSKYLGEMEVWRGIAEGLHAVIINPGVILGPGDWQSGSTVIFKMVHDGFNWYSEGVNGFVDVRDVAGAMIRLMNSPLQAERYVCVAENKSFREIFEKIAASFGKRVPSKKVTPFIASLIWRAEKIRSYFTGKEPSITKETASSALRIVRYDNSKLLHQLQGFSYRSMDDTITFTCTSLQQNLNKG
jgi:dihydroflavonol-4-reductase